MIRSRARAIFSLSYLGLYLLSGVYAIIFCYFQKPAPEFNPPSLVALPCTLIIIPIAQSWGSTLWYERLIGSPVLYGGLMTLILLPGALLNTIIFYWIGKIYES
jgi:hypothetical protein